MRHDSHVFVVNETGSDFGTYIPCYEIAEFRAVAGETYTIKIRRWSGADDVWYGIAWNTVSTPWVFEFNVEGVANRG